MITIVIAALPGGAAAAATTTTRPDPSRLWDAYPLEPGQAAPKVRLPADSVADRRPAVDATAAGDGGGGGASVPLILGVGLAALAVGVVGGRRIRRRPAPAGPPASAVRSPVPVAAPHAPPVAPPPPRRPAPPPPPPRRPAPAPAVVRAAPPAPLTPPPASGGRFRRVPWPAGTEDRWRCEITSHAGLVRADFRALASAPGRRRPVEIARTGTYSPPGWGNETPYEEQLAMVRELVAALRDAGWEPVDDGREWFAARFVWSRPSAPALKLPALASATTKEPDDDR